MDSIHDDGSLIQMFIGARGTGKSTKQSQVTLAYVRAGGRALIIPSSPYEPTFKRVPRVTIDQIRDIPSQNIAAIDCADVDDFAEVLEACDDILLVADDIRGYMPNSVMNKRVRQALISSRHRSVSFTMAVHGFTQVPPEFFMYVDLIWLFRTGDSIKMHRDKFKDLDKIVEAQKRVNLAARKDQYYFEIINNQT
jgi:hypothetical protein